MEKTINVGDKPVAFKATGSTPKRYRQKFQRDLFVDMRTLMDELSKEGYLTSQTLEIFEDVAYVMAYQADPEIPTDPDDWLDKFEILDIYQILPELIELWNLDGVTLAEPKKKAEPQSGE